MGGDLAERAGGDRAVQFAYLQAARHRLGAPDENPAKILPPEIEELHAELGGQARQQQIEALKAKEAAALEAELLAGHLKHGAHDAAEAHRARRLGLAL